MVKPSKGRCLTFSICCPVAQLLVLQGCELPADYLLDGGLQRPCHSGKDRIGYYIDRVKAAWMRLGHKPGEGRNPRPQAGDADHREHQGCTRRTHAQ